MSQYQETLERFQRYMLDEDTAMEACVVGEDLEFRKTRLNVYHDGYMLRLLEILGKCYPAVHLLMGRKSFEKVGSAYIAAYPSKHFSIALMGRHFGEFLAAHSLSEPVFVEMAAFEWILEQVMDASDAPQLTFDEIAAALAPEDWANLSLKQHPSVMTHAFHYPIPALWQHLIHEQEKPEITYLETPVQWLIWRFAMQAHFRSGTDDQMMLLDLLQQGRTFSEICDAFAAFMPEDQIANFVAGTMRDWVVEGVFSEYSVVE